MAAVLSLKDAAARLHVSSAHLQGALGVSPTVRGVCWQQGTDVCGPLRHRLLPVKTPRKEILAAPGSRSNHKAISQTHTKV